MFMAGGHAYIYLCYGLHHLFNVVTGPLNTAHAVLIRALQPFENAELMLARRKNKQPKKLTNGPALLTQALGITTSYDGTDLSTGELIWIENNAHPFPVEVVSSKRIGVAYAQECSEWEWRYYLKNNSWVSQ